VIDPATVGDVSGIAIGTSLAVVCSWTRNRSILWAMLHGALAWLYVIYFAVTRQPDEKK
jgi:ABC-type Fe3+-siderophore transport system permease subunit